MKLGVRSMYTSWVLVVMIAAVVMMAAPGSEASGSEASGSEASGSEALNAVVPLLAAPGRKIKKFKKRRSDTAPPGRAAKILVDELKELVVESKFLKDVDSRALVEELSKAADGKQNTACEEWRSFFFDYAIRHFPRRNVFKDELRRYFKVLECTKMLHFFAKGPSKIRPYIEMTMEALKDGSAIVQTSKYGAPLDVEIRQMIKLEEDYAVMFSCMWKEFPMSTTSKTKQLHIVKCSKLVSAILQRSAERSAQANKFKERIRETAQRQHCSGDDESSLCSSFTSVEVVETATTDDGLDIQEPPPTSGVTVDVSSSVSGDESTSASTSAVIHGTTVGSGSGSTGSTERGSNDVILRKKSQRKKREGHVTRREDESIPLLKSRRKKPNCLKRAWRAFRNFFTCCFRPSAGSFD